MQLSITHARRCLLHMHAGVYDTCTQVSMIFACRCLLHLLASHHSSEGNSDGYAIVYDTCTQVSMATARRCLWHMHANTLWSGWCYYNFDTFGYIWLWFIDKLTSWYILSRQFRNFQDNIFINCPYNPKNVRDFLETVWTLQEVSRQYTNCPENPETFRRYITCPENPETFWIIEKISGWFSA